MLDFTVGTATALANFATSTTAEHQTLTCLTKTIESMMAQLAERDAWRTTRDKEYKRLLGNKSGTPNASGTRHKTKKPYKTKNDNY
jgi:hypothetical protein